MNLVQNCRCRMLLLGLSSTNPFSCLQERIDMQRSILSLARALQAVPNSQDGAPADC